MFYTVERLLVYSWLYDEKKKNSSTYVCVIKMTWSTIHKREVKKHVHE